MVLDAQSDALVLALVHQHLDGPQYVSVVPEHYVLRKKRGTYYTSPPLPGLGLGLQLYVKVKVKGHARRQAFVKHALAALRCTAKFEPLSQSRIEERTAAMGLIALGPQGSVQDRAVGPF
tara:strand:- start:132 stop:491 length:360 start_codon:yes stop_codon:yes gene_type:complete